MTHADDQALTLNEIMDLRALHDAIGAMVAGWEACEAAGVTCVCRLVDGRLILLAASGQFPGLTRHGIDDTAALRRETPGRGTPAAPPAPAAEGPLPPDDAGLGQGGAAGQEIPAGPQGAPEGPAVPDPLRPASEAPAAAAPTPALAPAKARVVPPPAAPAKVPTPPVIIHAELNALGYKRPWTPSLDLKLALDVTGGASIAEIAADLGFDSRVVKDRWQVLSVIGKGMRQDLIEVLRERAGPAAEAAE